MKFNFKDKFLRRLMFWFSLHPHFNNIYSSRRDVKLKFEGLDLRFTSCLHLHSKTFKIYVAGGENRDLNCSRSLFIIF